MFVFDDPIDYICAVVSGVATLAILWAMFGPSILNTLRGSR